MQYLKLVIVFLIRIILRAFHIFPIYENQIVFISYEGRQYSCNPKYIFEYIYKHYGSTFKYIYCLNNKKVFPNEYNDVKIVKYLSVKYIWCTLTSKYIINNVQIEPIFPIRKNQIFINAWHGSGPYKRSDAFSPHYKKYKKYMLTLRNIRIKHTTYFVSSCDKLKSIFSEYWKMPEKKILSIGMPRNDILFSDCSFKEKIAKYYDIDKDFNCVLYAPTFRGTNTNPESFNFDLKVEEILENMMTKFKKEFIMIYRGHYYYSFDDIPNGVIFASNYPDMQELLCAADILITDYSSSVWDFSLMNKPCFLYAPDVKKYQRERGFYIPIEEWPFPLAETNEQLMENIIQFDEEKYKQKVKKHHEDLGSYETGTACEQLCNLLFPIRKTAI